MAYKVIALTVGGKANRIFKCGDIVTPNDFYHGHFDKLIQGGFIGGHIEELTGGNEITGEIKLAVVTGVWGRQEVFEMFAAGIKLLKDHFKGRMQISVCVAGSEGSKSKLMVEKHKDFYYAETPNQPLSQKMNKACSLAKSLNPDYCLMMGSDDLMGVSLIEEYYKQILLGVDYVYITDCYFFDAVSKKGLYWGGYIRQFNRGHAAGIGRMVSKRLLNHIDWQPWTVGFDRVLDTAFDKKIANINCSKKAINLKQSGCFALDIKSSLNMTPFTQWENSVFMDGKKLLQENLPPSLAKLIYGK